MTEPEKYANLKKACGGSINPDTLAVIRDDPGRYTPKVQVEFYQFMAEMVRMFSPPGSFDEGVP